MRRFLTSSFLVLALLESVIGIRAPFANAQALVPDAAPLYSPPVAAPLLNAGATEPTVFDSIAAAQAGTPKTDGSNKPLSFGGITDAILSPIMTQIMSIFAWILGLAMITLDYSVYYTVVKMGSYVQNLSAVGIAWRILRDLGNIALIFGFLAVGITTILNVDWYGGGKKFIPSLIIAAVFLNFSLFMTEAVIDTGNLFATQFYTQINGGVAAGSRITSSGNASPIGQVASVTSAISNEVISTKIMNQLGLQTLYDVARGNKPVFKGNNMTFISMMGILLFIVASFVMFSLAFILITRFIALIFIIILSPVGFAGFAIPQLASASKKWFDTLVEQTLTAPVLLLLLYIALTVITDANFLRFGTTGPDYMGFIQTTDGGFNLPGLASAVLSFSVAMGLLLSVVYFSKKLGAMGGDWATKTAGKLSFGAASFAMRSTAGRGLQRVSREIRTSEKFGRTQTGRLFAGIADRGAKGNFDIRSTGALKNFPGGGIDAGEAQKGGYRDSRDKSVKEHEGYVKSVGEAIDEKKAKEVIGAMRTRAAAEESFKKAGGGDFETKIKEQKEKVEDIKKQQKENEKSTIVGPAREARDRKTNDDLDVANQDLKKLTDSFKAISTPLEDAKKAEKKIGETSSQEKKAAQVAYAGNIEKTFLGVPLGGLVFGTGGSLAAGKLLKDAFKKDDDLKKKIKKMAKDLEEEEGPKKEEEKPKEAKPEESKEKGH